MYYHLYFSPTGGTFKVSQAVIEEYSHDYINDDLTNRYITHYIEFKEDDLVVISAPVYGGRIPQVVSDHLNQLKGNNAKAIIIAVYGNRDYEDALLEMYQSLHGFKVIGGISAIAQHSLAAEVAKGRPDEKDIQQLKSFVPLMKEVITSVPGYFPYKERKPSNRSTYVDTDSNCIHCGKCVMACPVGAIERNLIANNNCIFCQKCIQVCPMKCRKVNVDLEPLQNRLLEMCKDRKENELFIK